VSAQKTVNVFEPATLSYGQVSAVCFGSTLQLSDAVIIGGGATGGTWQAPCGIFSNPTNYQLATFQPTINCYTPITLTFTTNDPPGPCTPLSIPVPLDVLAPITANAGAPQTICQGIPIQLNGTMNSSATLATWSAPSGTFTNNPGLTPQYTADVPGNITLTMVASNPNAACNPVTSNVTMNVNPAATVDAGTATSMCGGSTINLNGVIGGGATSATWSSSNGTFGNPGSLTSTFTPSIATGTATLTLTTNDPPGPCPAVSDSVTVNVIIAPTANAGNDTSICEGETVTLNGSLGGIATIGTWSAPSGTFSNVNDLNAVYTPSITSGIVILTLSPDQPPGPCPSSSSNITISVNPEPTANAGNPITICEGESVVLSGVIGGGATSGTWSAPSGTFSDVNDLNATYTPAITSGSVTLTLTTDDPSGVCGVAISTVQVTVNPAPTVDAGTPQTICEGGSVTLAGSIGGGASSASWSAPSGTFGNPSSLNSSYSPAISNGVVTLTLTTDDPAGPCIAATSTVDMNVEPVYNGGVQTEAICQGETFTFGGTAYNSTGSYPFTFQSISGCDSTVTLNLTVHPTYTGGIQSESICQGDIFTFGGNDYTISGSYAHTFTSIFGCDSVVTLNLTVHPTYSAGVQVESICDGEIFTFGGTDYSVTGSYPFTFQTIEGCDSTVTLELTVTPVYSGLTETVSICVGDIYTFGGTDYSITGNYPFTFQSIHGCDSTVTLNLTVNTVYFDLFQNEEICEGDVFTFGGVDYSVAGNYTNVFQTVLGCDSTVTLNLTVNPKYTGGTQDEVICQGETFTFGGTDYNATGSYTNVFQTIHGCDSIVTLNLTVNPTYSDTLFVSICEGDTFDFQGTLYGATGNYPFNFATVKGCDSMLVLNLNVNPIPVVNIAPQADQCLAGNSFDYNVQPLFGSGATYNWTFTGGSPGTSNVDSPQNITYAAAGTYTTTLTVTENGCSATSEIQVVINPMPDVQFNAVPAAGCIPLKVDFTNLTIPQGGNLQWNFGNGLTSTDVAPTTVYTNAGTYTVSLAVTLPTGCSDTLTVPGLVTVQPTPSAGFSVQPPEVFIDDGYVNFLDESTGANNVAYNISNGGIVSGPDATYNFHEEGIYTIMQIVSNSGCADTAYGQVVVTGTAEVFIPNAFTPNDDALNTAFGVIVKDVAEFKIYIYNRWGELLFISADPYFRWDGTYGGKPCQQDMYMYKVEYRNHQNKFKTIHGRVLLIR
jgi:gliding motility-associated-like protein